MKKVKYKLYKTKSENFFLLFHLFLNVFPFTFSSLAHLFQYLNFIDIITIFEMNVLHGLSSNTVPRRYIIHLGNIPQVYVVHKKYGIYCQ